MNISGGCRPDSGPVGKTDGTREYSRIHDSGRVPSGASEHTYPRDIAAFIESFAPPTCGSPGEENGFVFGNVTAVVTGVAVCWLPTAEVIQASVQRGLSMIVCHEQLLYEVGQVSGPFPFIRSELKVPNLKRMKLLLEHDCCVYRAHTNWDVVPGGILDTLCTMLGMTQETNCKHYAICRVPPTTLRTVARQVKERLGLSTVKVVGDLECRVERVGVVGGGSGRTYHFSEHAAAQHADVLICGDLTDFTARYAMEAGIALIDAGHVLTENPGMRVLAERIKQGFENLPVEFIDAGLPWTFQ